MSDRPRRTRIITGTPRDFPPIEVSGLSVFGNFAAVRDGTVVIPPTGISYTGAGHGSTDGNVLYNVIRLPDHGTLLKDGVAATLSTQFTQQDVDDGRVAYRDDGNAGRLDSFDVFAEVTQVPGVVKPYTPQFYRTFRENTAQGTKQGAFYAGVLLAGSSIMPGSDFYTGASGNWGTAASVTPEELLTTHPNEVIFAIFASVGSATALPYPAPVPVATINIAGLTFTRLGGGSFNTINYDTIHGVKHYCTSNIELFYAVSPGIISTPTPFSATWAVTGQFVGPEECNISIGSFYGVGDLSHPWGTDPASIQMYTTYAVPGALSLNTSAPDQLVLPVLFENITGDYDGILYGDPTNYDPMGYSGPATGGGGGNGGAVGSWLTVASMRTSVCYATINIQLPPLPPVLIDSELLLQTRSLVFTDFAIEANRRKFISAEGTPAWMGVSGQLPFNDVPPVYLTTLGPPPNFTQNNGNGGAFVVSGEIDTATPGPGCSFFTISDIIAEVEGGRSGGFTVLPLGSYQQGAAQALSADGSVSAGWVSPPDSGLFQLACYWVGVNSPPVIIAGTDPDTGDNAQALGVSGDGSVIVGVILLYHVDTGAGYSQPFLWTLASGLNIGPPFSDFPGSATNVSADGTRITGFVNLGYFTGDGFTHGTACYWEAPTFTRTSLGYLPGHDNSTATAISADGSVIVGGSQTGGGINPTMRAFRWTAATGMVALPLPTGVGALWAQATGVSDDGNLIAGDYGTSGVGGSWQWTPSDGVVDIPMSGLSYNSSVSGDGSTILGAATDVYSQMGYIRSGVVTTPPPVPLDPAGYPGIIQPTSGYGISADGMTIAGSSNPGVDNRYLPYIYLVPIPGKLVVQPRKGGSDEWRLSLSDDGGETWSSLVKPRVVGTAGEYRKRLRWLKMGQSRQRLLKLENTGHTRRNIIGIYIDSEQGMDS